MTGHESSSRHSVESGQPTTGVTASGIAASGVAASGHAASGIAASGVAHRRALVVVASTRAAAGVYPDRTGPIIAGWLVARGWPTPEVRVVPDGDEVARALEDGVQDGVDLLVTTGGTGVNPTDRTPEATLPLIDRELPGLMEALRRRGGQSTPLAALSRGHAGVARGKTFVINLPGSTGGVKDGLAVLGEVLEHVIDQLNGGDHVG